MIGNSEFEVNRVEWELENALSVLLHKMLEIKNLNCFMLVSWKKIILASGLSEACLEPSLIYMINFFKKIIDVKLITIFVKKFHHRCTPLNLKYYVYMSLLKSSALDVFDTLQLY